MPEIGIDLFNFDTEEHANAVAQQVLAALQFFGKILNLSRLAQVIVAYDYDGALESLDRGTEVSRPLRATNTELAVGIAMTPKVIRNGELRAVMVLNANYVSVWLAPENSQDKCMQETFFYTLAHECGHVHDLEVMASTLPGVLLKMPAAFPDGVLLGIAFGCWEEYIACHLSAFMGANQTLRDLEETFCKSVARAREYSNAAIREYRMHADIGRLMEEVGGEYKSVMVYASYLLGHIDGLGGSLEDAAPKAFEALKSHDYFDLFFTRLHSELRGLQSTYGKWTDVGVFDPLKTLVDELLKSGGIDIQLRLDGTVHVNVPFSPETIPTLDEQVAFMAARA